MAQQMEMRLARLNVVVGIAKLDRIAKTDPDLAPVVAAAEAAVPSPVVAAAEAAVPSPVGLPPKHSGLSVAALEAAS